MQHMRFRAGKWEVRISVPKDVKAIVGKTILTERLSADRDVSKRTAYAVIERFHATIDDARERLNAGRLSVSEVARLFFDHALTVDDEARSLLGNDVVAELQSGSVQQRAVRLRQVAAGRVVGHDAELAIGHAIDMLVAERIIPFGPPAKDRPELLKALAQVQLDVIARAQERNRGSVAIPTPQSPHLLPSAVLDDPTPALPSAPRARARGKGITLVECLALFHAERTRANRSTIAVGTINEHVVTCRMFGEVVGHDVPVSTLTKADVLRFKSALSRLPNRYTMRFPGMTIPQAIAANEKRKAPFDLISTGTINAKYLSHLRAILKWCVGADHLSSNPADGVRIDEGNGFKEPARLPFTQDDLQRIFAKPLFGDPTDFGARQWALLVALYTGARSSSEIRRIKLNDIRQEQGIWVFDLIEASKNVQSKRLVPVHQRLIDLGLFTYVDGLREAGQTLLFPDWAKSRGDKVNRWFLRTYLANVAVPDRKKKVLHSFRNTLKTELSRCGVPYDIRDLIIGHKDQSAGAVYINDPTATMISSMRDGLNKVSFPILVES